MKYRRRATRVGRAAKTASPSEPPPGWGAWAAGGIEEHDICDVRFDFTYFKIGQHIDQFANRKSQIAFSSLPS